ncbi:MAG: DUF3850 domain-containing protein [Acidovorax sp.]|uniref:DUF3850 domain-containing protein n=1 Tax=Acidovorax sp. TaxID=1872122 RepID=UPI003919447B
MKTHIVKSWPKFFIPIASGERTHELRRDDRGYCVGDYLDLKEFEPISGDFTGRSCLVKITSLTSAIEPCAVSEEALNIEFCILSVKRVAD